jgi:hypothetical protein
MRVGFAYLLLISLILLTCPNAFAERKGFVSSRPCPHSCQSMGLPKKHCRDWRQGNLCYVEDLRRKPAPSQAGTPFLPSSPGSSGTVGGVASCNSLSRDDVAPPYITISKAKPSSSGGVFGSSKIRVVGEVEGRCLKEAGVFARGRKIATISIRTKPDFDRYEFNFRIRNEDNPQVRVYNIFGDRAFEEIVSK